MLRAQRVVDGELRGQGADVIREAGAKEHGAPDHVGEAQGVHVAQLAELLVRTGAVGVEPAGVVAQALVGNLVLSQLPDLTVVAEEGVQDASPRNQVRVERAGGQAHAASLRVSVHAHQGGVQAGQLPHYAAEDADVLVQTDVVHALGVALQAGNEVAGDRGPAEAAHVLRPAALAGVVHGDVREAQTREGAVLPPAAGAAGVAVEAQHQGHGTCRDGLEVAGVQARPAHAAEPQVKVLAGWVGRDVRGHDLVVQLHGVRLGHAVGPEGVEVRGYLVRARARLQLLEHLRRDHANSPMSEVRVTV